MIQRAPLVQQARQASSSQALQPQQDEDSDALLRYSMHSRETVPLIQLVHNIEPRKFLGFSSHELLPSVETRNQIHPVYMQYTDAGKLLLPHCERLPQEISRPKIIQVYSACKTIGQCQHSHNLECRS